MQPARDIGRLPSPSSRALLAFAGYHAPRDLLDRLDRSVVSGIAKPLTHTVADGEFVARAASMGLITALPGEAWRNQLHPDDKRRRAIAQLGYTLDPRIDPSEHSLSDGLVSDYGAAYVDAQISRGATLVGTPGHVYRVDGTVGRDNDLRLAHAAVKEWEARQGSRSRPDGRPTALFATITLHGAVLADDKFVTWLVHQYLGVGVDGFWISVFNCGQGKAQLAGATRLGLGLQSDGRFAILSGVGNAHLAALARGLSATCAGHHGMAPQFPPAALPTDEEDAGIGVHVYHSAILGSTALGGDWAPSRRALFASHPCACGCHPANEEPQGRARRSHNLETLQAEARVAITTRPADAASVFEERVRAAGKLRAQLKIGSLKAGWRGAASAPGWDDAAGAAKVA